MMFVQEGEVRSWSRFDEGLNVEPLSEEVGFQVDGVDGVDGLTVGSSRCSYIS